MSFENYQKNIEKYVIDKKVPNSDLNEVIENYEKEEDWIFKIINIKKEGNYLYISLDIWMYSFKNKDKEIDDDFIEKFKKKFDSLIKKTNENNKYQYFKINEEYQIIQNEYWYIRIYLDFKIDTENYYNEEIKKNPKYSLRMFFFLMDDFYNDFLYNFVLDKDEI